MDTISPDSDTQVQNEGAGQERVSLPRWVIYFQGALLGIVATTFFIFGMMVGSLTDSSVAKRIQSCRVSGVVFDASGDENRPDNGSVVVLLPVGSEFEEREDPTSIHPSRFQPLNNALIDKIHRMGGAVVRTDDSGRFEVFVESPQTYQLLVVSKNASGREKLTKSEMAGLAKYFMPVEDILDNNKFIWKRVSTHGDTTELGTLSIE